MLCVVMVLVAPSVPFIPGMSGVLPDLHGFYKWVFLMLWTSLERFHWAGCGQSEGGRGCVSGLVGFGRIWVPGLDAWLRPDFVPPSPFLVVKDPLTDASGILVEPHLIDAEFCKAWMPFFL